MCLCLMGTERGARQGKRKGKKERREIGVKKQREAKGVARENRGIT